MSSSASGTRRLHELYYPEIELALTNSNQQQYHVARISSVFLLVLLHHLSLQVQFASQSEFKAEAGAADFSSLLIKSD